MESAPFFNRRHAGQVLARSLEDLAHRADVVVLALPRGGVPVAFEVARALHAPLDIFLVRKLGAPGREELAMGAIASGNVVYINDDVVRGLQITPEEIQHVARLERLELQRREKAYRDSRPPLDVKGKIAVLIDDGLATGASMRAAVAALRQHDPKQIVVAVPVASPSTRDEFALEVDRIECAVTPEPFFAVGAWYEDFTQTSDDEVRALLAQAGEPHPTGP
jgi:predicted phosphoribosyltransferase